MKKILVTMLALSLAVVSTVDAKMARGRVEVGGGPVAKNIDDATANLKDASIGERDAAFAELVDVLKENEDLQKLVKLEAERAKIMAEKTAAEEEAKAKKSGLGWFFQSGDYRDAQAKVAKLKSQLAEKNKQIASIRRQATVEENRAVRYAMITIGTVMGLAALEYFTGITPVSAGRYGLGKMGAGATWTKEQYKKRAPVMLGGTPADVK